MEQEMLRIKAELEAQLFLLKQMQVQLVEIKIMVLALSQPSQV